MKRKKMTAGERIAVKIRNVDFKYISHGGDAERAARRIDRALKREWDKGYKAAMDYERERRNAG